MMDQAAVDAASISFAEAVGDQGAKLRGILNQQGFVVVTSILSAEDIARMEALWNEDVDSLVDHSQLEAAPEPVKQAYQRFKTEGSAALPLATAHKFTHAGAGFVLRRGLTQTRFPWAARGHPGVKQIYGLIWQDDDLIGSCDVPFFSPGGAQTAADCEFTAHVDQNATDRRNDGLAASSSCYQGVLYVWGSQGEDRSTTVLWPQSHHSVWPEMMKDEGLQESQFQCAHYSEISYMHGSNLKRDLIEKWEINARRVPVPAGSLLLWNSKLVHQGWCGGRRLAQTVCYEPRARGSAEQREKVRMQKLRLVALGLPSTHWASIGQQHDMTLDFGREMPVAGSADGEDYDSIVLPLKPAAYQPFLCEEIDAEQWEELRTAGELILEGSTWNGDEGAMAQFEQLVNEEVKQHI